MKPRLFLLLPLLSLAACFDTKQPDPSAFSPSTFDVEQFDALKAEIARLANQNSELAANAAEMMRRQDEIDRARLRPEVEFCQ